MLNLEPEAERFKSLFIVNSSFTVLIAYCTRVFVPARIKSSQPEYRESIITTSLALSNTTVSACVGTFPPVQVVGCDQSPDCAHVISSGILEVREILSIAAGGSVPAEVPLVHTKINLKVVPANDFGIKAVVLVVATCGFELNEINLAPAQVGDGLYVNGAVTCVSVPVIV